jgi:type III secretion system YscQ/HrcQ family protein
MHSHLQQIGGSYELLPGQPDLMPGGPARPRFERMSREDVDLVNNWYRRRHALVVQKAGLEFALSPKQSAWTFDDDEALILSVKIREQEILIFAEPRLSHAIASSYGVPPSLPIRDEVLFLLLADWLTSLLAQLENYSGTPITSMRRAGSLADLSDRLRLDGVVVSGCERFGFRIVVSDELKPWLAGILSEIPAIPADWDDLPCKATFYIGAVQIMLGQLRSVRLNDVILADAIPKQSDVLVVFGEKYAARARLADRRVTLLENPNIPALEQSGIGKMLTPLPSVHDTENQDVEFDAIQVTLVFEIGQQQLSLGDLRRLEPGYVFDLTRAPRTAVDIYAGTRRVGHGEIVEINETLGVRVTRLFNNE